MPYAKNDQLPENLQRRLPVQAQGVFREAFPAGRSFGSARDMHKANLFSPRLIEGADGFRCGLHGDRASFFLEIIARLGRQTHVAFLTRAYDQEIGAILIDKFRLLF
jgi:hypothetical protein